MAKKKNNKLIRYLTLIIGLIFFGFSILIWFFFNEGLWAEVFSEFFIVGLTMTLIGIGLMFRVKIKTG